MHLISKRNMSSTGIYFRFDFTAETSEINIFFFSITYFLR
jgi:hypothetical protein